MRTVGWQIFAIIAVASLAAVVTGFVHPKRPAWTGPGKYELSLADAESLQPLWVDARSREQFEQGHIPGAVLLNEDDWNDLLVELLGKWEPEQPIVVYCSSETCSASREVATRLREEAGFDQVHVLEGGWAKWIEANQGK